MITFVHESSGHYLGSTVVVLSLTREYAEKLIREELDKMGLKDMKVNIVAEHWPSAPKVVYSFSGDY